MFNVSGDNDLELAQVISVFGIHKSIETNPFSIQTQNDGQKRAQMEMLEREREREEKMLLKFDHNFFFRTNKLFF